MSGALLFVSDFYERFCMNPIHILCNFDIMGGRSNHVLRDLETVF